MLNDCRPKSLQKPSFMLTRRHTSPVSSHK